MDSSLNSSISIDSSMEDDSHVKEPLKAQRSIGYISDKRLCQEISRVNKYSCRSLMLHSLLHHTKLTQALRLFPLEPVSLEELHVFHSRDFVDFLSNPKPELEEEFGFGYDCEVIDNLDVFCRTVAAGTLTAADLLLRSAVQVAINWSGGWHHAKRDEAAGFCYINDVVLAIHRLQSRFKRILYIDLDVHHGDGVEDAFSFTDKVMTMSIHKREVGFFPGSGSVEDVGFGKGKFYSVNIPLHHGADDTMFEHVFTSVFPVVFQQFKPDAIVVQCGADGLVGDPLGGFNLTPSSLSACVQQVVSQDRPVLLLGGGGYNIPNTVRCWCRITADLLGCQLPEDIPDSDPFFLKYAPDFEFNISKGMVKNENSREEVDRIIQTILNNLQNIS